MISKTEIKELIDKNSKSLSKEIAKSKELMALFNKSTTEKLDLQERGKLYELLLNSIKSIPALAIFLLPGGMILLPLVAKIIPEIMPSSFRESDDESEQLNS